MICIIASNYLEAQRWAAGQLLDDEEWFYGSDIDAIKRRTNFHVVVAEKGIESMSHSYFERIFQVAKQQGSKE